MGDGVEPKLVKGPDVFLKGVAKLAVDHRLFVLLTGPARGYVKRGLDAIGVPLFTLLVKGLPQYRTLFPLPGLVPGHL